MSAELDDDECRPRADDHLVEPFYAGLGQEGVGRELRANVRRGCGGAAILVLATLLGLLAV